MAQKYFEDNFNAVNHMEGEIDEIIELLPALNGFNIIELGSGLGSFTTPLAVHSNKVVAVDFIERNIERNKEINKQKTNIEYVHDNVLNFKADETSINFVFSNWLFMYLDDEQVLKVFSNILSWLKEDGFLFLRESCFHSSERTEGCSCAHYRKPQEYMNLFEAVQYLDETNGHSYGFELVFSRSIQAYVKAKSNSNQICWLLQKRKVATHENQGFQTFQQFLDNKQYSMNGILSYEKIFGKHFISTGGKETTEEFVEMLDLKAGQHVLDIGCGIGGSAFYMAEKFGVTVLGMDLSANMVNIALERSNEINDHRVQFEISDATKRVYKPNEFDVLYSRDTILHISDKLSLFKSFLKWLKPGGKLLISDYCCSDGEHSPEFKAYVKSRGYILYSPAQYGKILENAGFINVKAEDKTELFLDVLTRELQRTRSIEKEFVAEFGEDNFQRIIDGWSEKIGRVKKGDQRWGLFYAEKE